MKKGFTLIELIAVITILAIILGMVVINTNYFNDNRRKRDYNNIVNIIEKNTKVYINTNDDVFNLVNQKLSNPNDKCKILYPLLQDANLMDKDTINPLTNKKFNKESFIEVKLDNNYDFIYTFVDKDKNENEDEIIDCLQIN